MTRRKIQTRLALPPILAWIAVYLYALVSASEAKWGAECFSFPRQFRLRVRDLGEKQTRCGISVFRGDLLVDLVGIEPTTSSMPWK
jgi:hypothetical protein